MTLRNILSVLVLLSVLLAGCAQGGTTPSASTDPLKVAVLAPLSGANPTFGVSTRDGALLAIEEWNAKGGVLGRQIEAVVEDSQCEADPAVNAANKVIDQDKVHFLGGGPHDYSVPGAFRHADSLEDLTALMMLSAISQVAELP
jgi:branched-chain amino acid transport system substrate-binding protein